VLVTNGELTEDVRLTIQSLNEGNSRRGFRSLRVIEKLELIKIFVDAHGHYLPSELSDLRAFLNLFNNEGKANLDRERLGEFLESVFGSAQPIKSAQAMRLMTSSILLTAYLLLPYDTARNHVALCEGWTLACAYVLRFAAKNEFSKTEYGPAVELMRRNVSRSLDDLYSEVMSRRDNFIEGSSIGDGALMYSIRITIVLGWLCTRHITRSFDDSFAESGKELLELVRENAHHVGVWGEYSIPFLFSIGLFRLKMDSRAESEAFLGDVCGTVAWLNNGQNKGGFPDPYTTPDELLSSFYSVPKSAIDLAKFAGSSYTLRALVDSLVFLRRRDLLEPFWKVVTHTRCIEFYPDEPLDLLLWRSEKGRERDFGYELPTSWAKLISELPDEAEIPDATSVSLEFYLYFVLTYPHRFRRDLIVWILRQLEVLVAS